MIQNNALKSFIDKIESDELTIESIDNFGSNIDEFGLKEFFDKIESEEISLFALKVYTTVYDKEKIKKLESLVKKSHIDSIFAAMWEREASDSTSKDLSGAMLGFVIFGSDLVSRIRNGYKLLGLNSNNFENQIENLTVYLFNSIKNKTFFKDLTMIKTNTFDDEVFNSENDNLKSIKKIKERIEFANLIISNDDEIIEKIKKYNNVSMEDLTFLNQELLSRLESVKRIKDDRIDPIMSEVNSEDSIFLLREEKNELAGFDVIDYSDTPSEFTNFIKSIFKKSKLKKEKNNSGGVKLSSLRTKKSNSKGSSFKVAIALFLFIAIAGIGIIAATQKTKVSEEETMGEKIAQENVDNKSFLIKRTGTNKD